LDLSVQRDVELGGEFAGVEGAAGEKAVSDLKRGNFAAAVIDAQDQVLGIGIIFDVHFAEFHAAILQKIFHAAAIGTIAVVLLYITMVSMWLAVIGLMHQSGRRARAIDQRTVAMLTP
jgi:hypothetical protein